ncbi:hypothetical protein [Halopseudomonas bauzanensis]|uniref:hypothetical protein n=1 Tax=Halopseudomonas bauzanensis TaxID=653930 RepID=UPI002552919A|nr:hypothetical protein [Halopseudomonas bauzanensis]
MNTGATGAVGWRELVEGRVPSRPAVSQGSALVEMELDGVATDGVAIDGVAIDLPQLP